MIEARRRFLDTGMYLPLAEKISEILLSCIRDGVVLDAGCGEGYYTDILERRLSDNGKAVSFLAFDISKEAVKRAAKRNKNIEFAVASSYSVPLSDESVNAVVNIFSPMAIDEMRRILLSGGVFAIAIPDKRHLYELKSVAYDMPYENEVLDKELFGFRLIKEEKLSYDITLKSSEDINSLFMMTPYAYRTSKEGRERISNLEFLKTRAEFIILLYRKV